MRIGYYQDQTTFSSQPLYRCEVCQYDSFSEDSAQQHIATSHPAQKFSHTRDKYQPDISALKGLKVGIGLLTWNTLGVAGDAALAVARECSFMRSCGINAWVLWADNGSTDGTKGEVRNVLSRNCIHYKQTLFKQNVGQSEARNAIIKMSSIQQCDYLALVDGDVVIVPKSLTAMVEFMSIAPLVGCLGAHPTNCTRDPTDPDIMTESPVIDPLCYSWKIALTQYGVFRTQLFKYGVKFSTDAPFQGPGWGFEDDDFGLQIKDLEFVIGPVHLRHYHRRRSGLLNLDPSLAAKVYTQRQQYIIRKWGNKADHINREPLTLR